jgi:DNA-binding XRE family transcriptional regulator
LRDIRVARVKKVDHDSWHARWALQEKAEAAELRLPEAVAAIRLALGLTQAEFGKAFGLRQRVISDLENGRGNPSLKTLLRLALPMGFTVGFVPKLKPGAIKRA